MDQHPILERFDRVAVTTSGLHVYDFLGTATRVSFKRGWENHAMPAGRTHTAGLPPKNEHYLDWIALLRAVDRARGVFRMAELGAGWAPWLVRGAFAARQRPVIQRTELLGIEADPTHYDWMGRHLADNGLTQGHVELLHGAAAATAGTLAFPVVEDPTETYGASLAQARKGGATISVAAHPLPDILARFSGPLDFLHVDIQGAEYEALPPAMDAMNAVVKSVMVGTHQSDAAHDGLVDTFRAAGWTEVINLARARTHATPWGEIAVGDGFVLFDNPRLV